MVAVVVLLARATQARTLQAQSPKETAAGCVVKHADVNASAMSDRAFSGRVRAGESYQCEFIQGFVFRLEPTADGWEIAVREENRTENLVRLTPSVNGRSPVVIAGADFAGAANSTTNPPIELCII